DKLTNNRGYQSPHHIAATPPSGATSSGYPRYRLIDLGTLGGPNSNTIYPARGLNNRGLLIASAETAVPDPNCYLDCYYSHAIQRAANGGIVELPFPSGIDPSGNYSLAGDLTANGYLGGFITNGEMDPLTDFPQLRPVVWGLGDTVWNLGTFGGNSGAVNMLNARGDAVGMALNTIPENPDFASFMNGFIPAATQSRAFLWQGNALQDLGTLGGNDAAAFGINESGLVFGMSYTDTTANDATGLPTTHPFLWKNGQMWDLGTLGGVLAVPGSFAYGSWGAVLNARGQAIGTSTLAGDVNWHAFIWDNGMMTDLGTLGGNTSEALAIDDDGWISGRADFSPDSPYHHAVLWRNGVIRDLGVVTPCDNSTATARNSDGYVVGGLGHCTDNPNDLTYFSAFLWRSGKTMVDLNSLVSPQSDLHIEFATGINNAGEIAGNAYLPTGELHAVLLIPLSK
ncbi:MAG: hypothetical protein KGL13_04245, partial [Gammaproteobacteria bacterium]|nr:hypothetical protein [Gammaproteobacteria bacterium]